MKFFFQLLLFILTLPFILSTTDDPKLNQRYKITKVNSGNGVDFPVRGNKVKVHYTKSSNNQPFEFTIGAGQVMMCLDEMVSHMSIGEQIYFVCPSALAYGSKADQTIPNNSEIAFEVQLLQITRNPKKDL